MKEGFAQLQNCTQKKEPVLLKIFYFNNTAKQMATYEHHNKPCTRWNVKQKKSMIVVVHAQFYKICV